MINFGIKILKKRAGKAKFDGSKESGRLPFFDTDGDGIERCDQVITEECDGVP